MARLFVLALALALLAIPGAAGPALGAKAKCAGLEATKVGTNRAQVIRGTKHDDVIVAKGGSDRIYGNGGKDVICAGPGNDVIEAGAGQDHALGGGGNDTVKGGAGRDVLDGGGGDDGCYPAAGGDKLRDCEEADLAVTIAGPASVGDGSAFEYSVRVTNFGHKRSGPYSLTLSVVPTAVLCSQDHSGVAPFEAIWPGAFAETFYEIAQGCVTQSGSDWHLDINASAEMSNKDDDLSNNQTTARINVTPSGAAPTPTPTPTPPLAP
jgi:hypothetical protein